MISLPNSTNNMTKVSFYSEDSYSKFDTFEDDYEHDDFMSADDYDRKQYHRDGWNESKYDRQYW